ncbi:3-methyladenine DNA glycosylase Mpg [Pseudarthrobacter defluvii]|nr:3-methyladenine DNA glycosylase Mpg [Pseudarthrobacter defluvii]
MVNESTLGAERLRDFLSADARELAPQLLGAVLTHESRDGAVSVRLTEVEAYMGPEDSLHPDPGSHTYRGPTPRNAPMFGPAGHLYVYFTLRHAPLHQHRVRSGRRRLRFTAPGRGNRRRT